MAEEISGRSSGVDDLVREEGRWERWAGRE
jgi:hypothetical protein